MILLQHLIDALALGSLYALAALGIGLIFGVVRLINFAHGDLIMVGAYALTVPSASIAATLWIGAWPWPLMAFTVVAIVVAVALLTERAAFRPLRNADPATLLISSFAVSYILQNAVRAIYTSNVKGVGIAIELTQAETFWGLRASRLDLLTILTSLALLVALALFLKKTSHGIILRAAAVDFAMARMLGVSADRVIAIGFALSGLLAGIVSLLFVVKVGTLSPTMGVNIVLFAFVATVIGGMGSLAGAVAGGYLVGGVSVLLQAVLPLEVRGARDAFVFLSVIAILLLRPNGLFRGRAARERV